VNGQLKRATVKRHAGSGRLIISEIVVEEITGPIMPNFATRWNSSGTWPGFAKRGGARRGDDL
jgi:hypothetical protein